MFDTRPRRRAAPRGLLLFAGFALAPASANAAIESRSYTLGSCAGGIYHDCRATSFLSTEPAGADSAFIGSPSFGGSPATFTRAFDAWNAAAGGGWRLIEGGSLDLTISPHVEVSTNDSEGGLFPVLFTIGVADPATLAPLSWTQAIVTNDSPVAGRLSPPVMTLDTFSFSQNAEGDNSQFPKTCVPAAAGATPRGSAFCGPIYPFQYGTALSGYTLNGIPLGDNPFVDGPAGPWPDSSFQAVTLLSAVSTATETLTVYQGVSYGYGLAVNVIPEPATWALALCGFAVLGLARAGLRGRPA